MVVCGYCAEVSLIDERQLSAILLRFIFFIFPTAIRIGPEMAGLTPQNAGESIL
jgi:hypothetical protein